MTIPDYQTIMLPLLQFSGDQKEHSNRESTDTLAKQFKLNEEEKRQLLPSGQQPIFDNRVAWARTYMKKAGLLESTKRGFFQITKQGAKVLKEKPSRIDVRFLEQFPAFKEFRAIRKTKIEEEIGFEKESQETPAEALENAYVSLRENLVNEILQQIKASSPNLFEKIVVELLVTMGYGGTRKDAGEAIGKSGDEGIDGIIKEDRLGLDIIYIQAKKWEATVGRPEIQKFAGALQGQRAKKGIFITTSNYSKEAKEYASRIDSKIVLIDGEQLAQFMIDCGMGVSSVATYEIKRIDSDYFEEE
jgi:restriction system protein